MIVNATTAIEDLTLLVEQEIHVHASLEDTFAALLEQLGPGTRSAMAARCRWCWRLGREAAGIAISATTTGTSGRTCRPSSGPRCWNFADP